jgi:hypothetical protein
MPKTKISEFSATPANNTDIDSINIAEGCAPSGINDAIRELMAQLKDFQTGAVGDSFNGPVGTTTAAAGAFTTLAASGAVTLSGGTANGVTYLNGSKVLTSGSALVFDGSALGIGTSSISGKLSLNETDLPFMTLKRADTVKAYFGIGNGSSLSGVAAAGDTILRAEQKLVMRAGGDTGGATIDALGNLGLGVTPSAWGSVIRAVQVNNTGMSLFTYNAAGTVDQYAFMTNNSFQNSSYVDTYVRTNPVAQYRQLNATHIWETAASGTAGNAITFTQSLAVGKGTTLALEGATSQSGTGITFPATQSASSNANTLDDYEEGSFTATLTCTTSGTITLSYNTLYYTKIGRQVTITGYLEVSSVSSPVGAVRLNGLPFTVANLNVQRVPLNVSTDGLTATAVTQIMGHLEENQTRGQINKYSAGTQSGLAGNVQAGTWFAVGATYFTS